MAVILIIPCSVALAGKCNNPAPLMGIASLCVQNQSNQSPMIGLLVLVGFPFVVHLLLIEIPLKLCLSAQELLDTDKAFE